ncbi:hypothetical protein N510_000715 [Firmicutes bacterium ASF500]|nr:hypothetical protein N510_000715 [Firmicutes bacterium ASF500]
MEKRKWTNIKAVEIEIIKMCEEGRTRQEIADTLGFEKCIMKKYDLLVEIRRPRKWVNMGQEVHRYENLLSRDFHADKPNPKPAKVSSICA